ncbi:MAG TPA: serine/threonine-protein kinase, partial [Polyangiaceae bacterium]|nr:serine/threonine-protein kinase [Polyangiaceae bacterium]
MTAPSESESNASAEGPSATAVLTSDRGAALRRARWLEERRAIGKIGRYTVLGQIAGGGMGSVFVAQMSGPAAFSRLVAIKCLHTRWLDDPKYVARFTTEVKLSTLIRHPHVVQTLDVVDEGGELFLVMEYVDGVTLAALLADLARANRPLPVGIALGILCAVLRGLHAAHEAVDRDGSPCHIVHRDVSPQNIMLSRNGHVQVLDFGAAKAVEHSQHTAAGVLVG